MLLHVLHVLLHCYYIFHDFPDIDVDSPKPIGEPARFCIYLLLIINIIASIVQLSVIRVAQIPYKFAYIFFPSSEKN